jgi:hypothetical protein
VSVSQHPPTWLYIARKFTSAFGLKNQNPTIRNEQALGWRKRRLPPAPLPSVALWVPCWFHLFFALCFFALGFFRENRWMTSAGVANLLLGAAIHLAPYRARTLAVTLRGGDESDRCILTLKAAALKLGFVDEAEFDRVVDPAKMVKPYVAAPAAAGSRRPGA